MVAVLVITRRVKVKRRHHVTVQKEVEKGLTELSKTVQGKFEDSVQDWEDKPQFKPVVQVTERRWRIYMLVSKRNMAGKVFGWVDKGTGLRGGGKEYEIRPKKAKYLSFTVPHSPVTLPNPAIAGFPPTGDPKTINAQVIIHPGIYPRNFTKTIMTWLKSKEPGAFRSVIEASVKRAYRKIRKGESS
jgi:hypothetical protein